ncbi:hypothetical protein [Burkholderia sp. PU8-34]
MKVGELIALLSSVDREAIVLVYPQYADYDDGGALREVLVPEAPWIHEAGDCWGGAYEAFYPGEAEVRDNSYSLVETSSVSVVLLGEKLGNFRLVRS